MSEMMIDVDDALRAQQMKALWDKYGRWIIGLVVIALLTVGIGTVWHNILNKKLTQQTNQLLTILQNEAEDKNTAKTLEKLHKQSDFPLKSVVGLYRAQKLEQGKDIKGAQKVYKEMTTQKRLPQMIRDLAIVHYVRLGIIQSQDAKKLLKVIDPVASKATAFQASAMELKGLLLRKSGKNDEANKVFATLSTNSEIPGTLRQRAKSLIREEGTNAQ